jgi:hypothetical protein
MDIDVVFTGVAVTRLDVAAWWERLFGRPADIIVNENEVMWRLSDSAWLYLVRDGQRAGRGLAALCVPDLDKALAEVAGRGIERPPVRPEGDAALKASLTDPEGNTVHVIQVTS